jgi:hypothetical protein
MIQTLFIKTPYISFVKLLLLFISCIAKTFARLAIDTSRMLLLYYIAILLFYYILDELFNLYEFFYEFFFIFNK